MNTRNVGRAFRLSLILLSIALLPQLHADVWSKSTKLTFTDSVRIPGHVLPAGTYVFRLMNSSNRHVVEVWDEQDLHLIATVIAIPDYRFEPTGKTVMTFAERGGGRADAIKEWFYPGDNFGQEFVYPKGEVLETAKADVTYTPIPAPAAEAPTEPAPTPAAEAPPQDTQPEPQAAPPVAEAPAPQEPAPAPEPAQLPKTGGELPLIGLLGFASVGSGLVVRVFRRR